MESCYAMPPPPHHPTKSPPTPSSSPSLSSASSAALIETKRRNCGERSDPFLPSSSSPFPLMKSVASSATKCSTFPLEPKIEHIAGSPSFSPLLKSPRLSAPQIRSSSRTEVVIPRPLESLQSAPIPPFLSKTYELVDDPLLDAVISWGATGESFVVWDPAELSRSVLPRHFKHNNFSSFVRQLNTYGFRKIGADRWEFTNENFLQGKKSSLKKINRHRSSQAHQIGTPIGSSVELGKSELEGEFQNLRREKNLLMQEVGNLKQEHLMTIQQMDTLNQRMQSAELTQKQMVSFLAKVLQNPLFSAHLKQQKQQRVIASRVRRKFLTHQQPIQRNSDESMEQQIAKYELDSSDATSSSTRQGNEDGNSKQFPDHHVQDIVGKLGIDTSGEEPLGGSDEPGVRMLDPFFMDSDTSALEGKDFMNFQTDFSFNDIDYFISSPEYITPDKLVSDDELVPASESTNMTDSKTVTIKGKSLINYKTDATISGTEYTMSTLDPKDTLQEKMCLDPIAPANREEIWNPGVEVEGSYFSSCHDDLDDFIHYDGQGLEVDAGPCALWDLDLHIPEGLEIDKYVGKFSSQEHKSEVGVLNKDHPKDLEP